MTWQEEQDDVIQVEPILPKKGCRLEIASAESAQWTVKDASKGGAPGHAGEVYRAVKLTLTITDPDVQTEYEGSRPRLILEHQFNLDRYPYLDKPSGTVKLLGRQSLHELEGAFGFAPIFVNGQGQPVEPYVTRSGRKMAPRGEGIKRLLNPDFLSAYFTADGHPNLEWAGKTVYADIGLDKDRQYGDRNRVLRFTPKPDSFEVV